MPGRTAEAALPRPTSGGGKELAAAEDEGPKPSASFSLDFTTAYFFRGIKQETRGLIAQPCFEVEIPLGAAGGSQRRSASVSGPMATTRDGVFVLGATDLLDSEDLFRREEHCGAAIYRHA